MSETWLLTRRVAKNRFWNGFYDIYRGEHRRTHGLRPIVSLSKQFRQQFLPKLLHRIQLRKTISERLLTHRFAKNRF